MRRPRCPVHRHSTVWFDGTYGTGHRRRQRYKCVPANGEKRHVFTEPLPRQRTLTGDCDECERALGPDEGPPAARKHHFTAREIAAALVSVGQGMTYRATARAVRYQAGRLRPARGTIPPHASRDSSVVEDWVEVYAPTVLADRLPKEWPDVLILDDLPFRIRSWDSGSGSVVAFRVFGAMTTSARGHSSLVRTGAFGGKRPSDWQRFFASLPGEPSLIVCDNESGMLKGIELAFGSRPYASPVVWLCHYHLRVALLKLFKRHSAHPMLSVAVERAFTSELSWQRLVRLERRYPCPGFRRWLDADSSTWWTGPATMNERVIWQLRFMDWDLPVSIGALEAEFAWLRDKMKQRAFAFRNRERTNRMLGLMQLHRMGHDDANAYSRDIRAALLERGGYGERRGIIRDRRGLPSLWT